MRVLQSVFPVKWFERSMDTANSLYAFIAGASASEPDPLIDDNWFTRISPLDSTHIGGQEGMVFWAKDGDTLNRGLRAVARDMRKDGRAELSGGTFDLTACGLTWDLGSPVLQSKALIAIKTITYNAGLFFVPKGKTTITSDGGGGKLGKHSVTISHRPYQNISHNLEKASRDNLMVQRGAAILVLRSADAPPIGPRKGQIVQGRNGRVLRESAQRYADWGGAFRQIGSTMSLGTLASLVPELV